MAGAMRALTRGFAGRPALQPRCIHRNLALWREIECPDNVSIKTVQVNKGMLAFIEGPLGENIQHYPPNFKFRGGYKRNDTGEEIPLSLGCEYEKPKLEKQFMGTLRSLTHQKIEGVTQGFKRQLNLVGVGYRAKVVKPGLLELKLGYSHDVNVEYDESELEIIVPNPTNIFIKGIDLQKVTAKAAEIRKWRKPEPYKGKGIFYKGETIQRKEGKKN